MCTENKNLQSKPRRRVLEMLDGPAVSALGVRSRKLSNIGRSSNGDEMYYLELFHALEGTLNR
jgi:hypothetical protein